MIDPLYVRDLNGDGWPDAVIPSGRPNLGGSGVLMNTESAFGFTAFASIESWLEYDVAAPIDLDGDGRFDLFFGERGGNPVLVQID